ncbi:MAG: class I SAM-dependent methyltransferase [Spirochaetia bacterium]
MYTTKTQSTAAIKDFFDKKAECWDKITFHDPEKLEEIMTRSELRRGQTVLDIGTGTGVMIPWLHRAVGDTGTIIAMDISEEMVRITKEKYGHIQAALFCNQDFYQYTPDQRIDAVFAYSCFPHFTDKPSFFRKCRSILPKRTGKVIIAHSESKEAINSIHEGLENSIISQHLEDIQTLKAQAEQAGFTAEVTIDSDSLYFLHLIRK